MDGVAAFTTVFAQHVVANTDVGEGAAHHHFVVAATCAVLVEVGNTDAMVDEVFAGRRLCLDRTGRRDVVGGDLVAEEAEDACTLDVADLTCRLAHSHEVRWVLHIGRVVVPCISLASRNLNGLPVFVALEHVRILLGEDFAGNVLGDEFLDFS